MLQRFYTRMNIKMGNIEQLSLFDIELPPMQEATEIKKKDEEKIQRVNPNNEIKCFARVPKEEYTNWKLPGKIPKVTDILKLVKQGTYRVGVHKMLSDIFECGAIAISNRFDKMNAEKREKRYLQIIKQYDKGTQQLMVEIFTQIYLLLTNQIHGEIGLRDYLGELYMQLDVSNKNAGQFFTPYDVSKLCAKLTINKSTVWECIEQDRILTLNEPACGSGGMVIAAADVLYNDYQFNIARNLLVECSDIDARCIHMSYLQLGLAGIPAIIYQRDTLTMETWDRWETPAYIMQWHRFKDCLRERENA